MEPACTSKDREGEGRGEGEEGREKEKGCPQLGSLDPPVEDGMGRGELNGKEENLGWGV